MKKHQQGFTLIEVLVAAFVLTVAVVALFSVSSRSLALNSQASKLQGAALLAEDAFSAVQQAVFDNALTEDAVFGEPFGVCQSGGTCQIGLNPDLTALFAACTPGSCDSIVRTDEGFMVQDANKTSSSVDTGYQREIQMEVVGDREMLVVVVMRWSDRGRNYQRTYTRSFFDWYDMDAYYEYGRLIATVVECSDESYLPNWSGAGPAGGIEKDTAADYVAANPNCWLSPGWEFQWGYLSWAFNEGGSRTSKEGWIIDESRWVTNTPLEMIGPADGSGGPGTYTYDPVVDAFRDPYTNEWKTFGNTDEDGRTAIIIPDPSVAANFMLRVVTKPGYVPFSYFFDEEDPFGGPGDDYSAEMYCRDDVKNYDNFDYIEIQSGANVYYCVAFMAQI